MVKSLSSCLLAMCLMLFASFASASAETSYQNDTVEISAQAVQETTVEQAVDGEGEYVSPKTFKSNDVLVSPAIITCRGQVALCVPAPPRNSVNDVNTIEISITANIETDLERQQNLKS